MNGKHHLILSDREIGVVDVLNKKDVGEKKMQGFKVNFHMSSTRLFCDTIGQISQSLTTFLTLHMVGSIEWE